MPEIYVSLTNSIVRFYLASNLSDICYINLCSIKSSMEDNYDPPMPTLSPIPSPVTSVTSGPLLMSTPIVSVNLSDPVASSTDSLGCPPSFPPWLWLAHNFTPVDQEPVGNPREFKFRCVSCERTFTRLGQMVHHVVSGHAATYHQLFPGMKDGRKSEVVRTELLRLSRLLPAAPSRRLRVDPYVPHFPPPGKYPRPGKPNARSPTSSFPPPTQPLLEKACGVVTGPDSEFVQRGVDVSVVAPDSYVETQTRLIFKLCGVGRGISPRPSVLSRGPGMDMVHRISYPAKDPIASAGGSSVPSPFVTEDSSISGDTIPVAPTSVTASASEVLLTRLLPSSPLVPTSTACCRREDNSKYYDVSEKIFR